MHDEPVAINLDRISITLLHQARVAHPDLPTVVRHCHHAPGAMLSRLSSSSRRALASPAARAQALRCFSAAPADVDGKIWPSAAAAIADVPNGATLLVGGFGLW